MDDKEWRKSLSKFLFKFLKKYRVEEDPELRKKLVTKDALNIWEKVFTHPSYNPNIDENYEQYEKLGDAVMKMQYISLLMEEVENITPELTTYYVHNALSKYSQGELALKLGLTDFLRTNIPTNISHSEDLLEAFFGGLLEVGNKIFEIGAGYVLTWNLITELYSGNIFEKEKSEVHPKIAVKNIMEKLSLPRVEEEVSNETIDNKYFTKIVLKLPEKSIKFFKDNGINIPNIIAKASALSKPDASYKAYETALKTLKSYGITIKYADDYKNNLMYLKNENLRIYESEVLQKLKTMGYTGLDRQKFHVENNVILQLLGVKDGKKYVLFTKVFTSPNTLQNMLAEMFKDFLKQK